MKRFLLLILAFILLMSGCSNNSLAQAYTVEGYNDMNELAELIEEQVAYMDAAHQMAEAARALGYEESHGVIKLAQQEWAQANELRKQYQAIYDELQEHWALKEQEYPDAAFVWSYFKNLGYSNAVCAGLLGNMMAECGGNTLALQSTIYGNGYYGICQWSQHYSSEVWGASLEEQCNFLQSTIEEEINMFGGVYKSGFDYDQFLALTSPEAAALAFAKCYERGGSGSYGTRQNNAIIAYNYFVS